MVLAVNVRADGPTHGHLAGTRQHRYPQAERQCGLHQLIQAYARVDVRDRGLGADRVHALQRRHVDDDAAAVARVVAVGAAQTARHDATSQMGGAVGARVGYLAHRLGNDVDVRGGEHMRHGGCGAAEPGQGARSER
ncbi:Uncharacterised protein [Mycobacteroides abscessus subsp. abscessus]|nr:Uncharacterised protein [Mycobacteroides abscessus subsp. abscessus]